MKPHGPEAHALSLILHLAWWGVVAQDQSIGQHPVLCSLAAKQLRRHHARQALLCYVSNYHTTLFTPRPGISRSKLACLSITHRYVG
jgi:hypothetical protein